MARLRKQLIPHRKYLKAYREFTDKMPCHEWSAAEWSWALESGATHHLFLEDDVELAPGFLDALRAMIAANPAAIIGLEAAHPDTPKLYAAGHTCYTTKDGLIGVGYCLPHAALTEFLAWRSDLPPGAVEEITQDTLIDVWALITKRFIWHPVPTIIDHDTSLASTFGNDAHANRRPLVTWRSRKYDTSSLPLEAPERWRQIPQPMGRYYAATPYLAAKWSPASYPSDRFLADIQEWDAAQATRRTEVPKVVIATPTRDGMVAERYCHAYNAVALRMRGTLAPIGLMTYDDDVVRARSRIVRRFLEETNGDILFFWDADVEATVPCVVGMARAIAAGKDFVCAPYPKKQIYWDEVDAAPMDGTEMRPAESLAYHYPVRLLPDGPRELALDAESCTPIAGVGLGCAMLTRRMLLEVTEAAAAEGLSFRDVPPPGGEERPLTAAPFMLLCNGVDLLSEDHSFAARARSLGFPCYLYLGNGSPCNHIGMHVYRGSMAAFGGVK